MHLGTSSCRRDGRGIRYNRPRSLQRAHYPGLQYTFGISRERGRACLLAVSGCEAEDRRAGCSDQGWDGVACEENDHTSIWRPAEDVALGDFGYNWLWDLGKRIEAIAKALGMSVIIADRKGVPQSFTRAGRIEFLETLQKSTAIVLCCPLDASTRGMIGKKELKTMDNKAILINVSRGGVVGEEALVEALRAGWIAGAATDVFATEPASASTSPLLAADVPNLTLSPHVAWYADSSIENLKRTIKSNIEGFVAGSPVNMV